MYYYSFNDYIKETFGEKLYKISLDGGMTCPNRDGTLGFGGCIFCSKGGSGEFAEPFCEDINLQIEKAKEKVKNKSKSKRFIAYFQSYTNTYEKTSYLKELFEKVIARDDIAALSIATRPDCIDEEKAQMLHLLNKTKPVFVELGLQSANEETAKYIRRGYSLAVFEKAMELLRGLHTVVHQIIGLPFETREDYFKTADYIANSGAKGIKLQLLHVLKGTQLHEEYKKGVFVTLEKEEYLNIVTDIIERLPRNMVIHRLTGDGAKKLLVAPLWSANKKDVLNSLSKMMREKNTVQGKLT